MRIGIVLSVLLHTAAAVAIWYSELAKEPDRLRDVNRVTEVSIVEAPPALVEQAPQIRNFEFNPLAAPSFDPNAPPPPEMDFAPTETVQDFVEDPSAQDAQADLSALTEEVAQPEVAVAVTAPEEAAPEAPGAVLSLPGSSAFDNAMQSPSAPGLAAPRAAPRIAAFEAPRPPRPAPPSVAEAPPVREEPAEVAAAEPEPVEAAAPPESATAPAPEPEPEPEPAPQEVETAEQDDRALRESTRPPARPRDFAQQIADAVAAAEAARVAAQTPPPAPEPTAEPTPEPAPAPTPSPAPAPETPPAETQAAAVNPPPAPAPVPVGPPLTIGEKDALRVSVQRCWNVPAGLANAADLRVVLAMELDTGGRIIDGPRLIEPTATDTPEIKTAFDAARRALLRCQAGGYDLPVDKYEHWRFLEVVFDPKGMLARW